MTNHFSGDNLYVYPEQCSSECLFQKLKEFGVDENCLLKIKDNPHDVVRCFYDNLASLPRRLPRSNRRKQMTAKLHLTEDRTSISCHSTVKQFQSSTSPQNKPFVKTHNEKNESSSSINSMSEMAKLEARSQAAKQIRLQKTNPNEPGCKKLKLIVNGANKNQQNTNLATSATTPKTTAINHSSPTKQINVRIISTSSNETSTDKRTQEVEKNDGETVKVPRKKLKRNSFTPSNQQPCTLTQS